VSHLLHLLNRISLSSRIGNRRILALVALFHDIHYCPVEKNNNEARSKEVFKNMVDDNYINKEDFQNICYIIEESNYSNLEMPRGSNREMLLSEFAGYDLIEPLLVSPVHIISDRVKIFKEYQNCNLIEFKDGSRKAFRNIANYIKMRIPVYYEKLVPNSCVFMIGLITSSLIMVSTLAPLIPFILVT